MSSMDGTVADKAAGWIIQRMKAAGLFSISSEDSSSSYASSSIYNASNMSESVADEQSTSSEKARGPSSANLQSLRRARQHCKTLEHQKYVDAKKQSYHELRRILSLSKRLDMTPGEFMERMERGDDLASLIAARSKDSTE
jgi:transglutaminase/protease-like cytokinesis protein 3